MPCTFDTAVDGFIKAIPEDQERDPAISKKRIHVYATNDLYRLFVVIKITKNKASSLQF